MPAIPILQKKTNDPSKEGSKVFSKGTFTICMDWGGIFHCFFFLKAAGIEYTT